MAGSATATSTASPRNNSISHFGLIFNSTTAIAAASKANAVRAVNTWWGGTRNNADDAQAAHPRAQDVEGIDASCLFAEVRKDEANPQPSAKERQHHQQINGEQFGRWCCHQLSGS